MVFWPFINCAQVNFEERKGKLPSRHVFRLNMHFRVVEICISTTKLLLTIAPKENTSQDDRKPRMNFCTKTLAPTTGKAELKIISKIKAHDLNKLFCVLNCSVH